MLISGIGYTGKENKALQKGNLQTSDKTEFKVNGKSKVSFGSQSFSDTFSSLLKTWTQELPTLKDVLAHDKRECHVEAYIDVFAKKKYMKLLQLYRKSNIEDFNNELRNGLGTDTEFFNVLFKSAGINTVFSLENFVRTYTCNPDSRKIFKRQEIEAVEIYGFLRTKHDIAKYPELLLYLYNQEEEKENPDYGIMNEYTDFLKKIGLNDFKDFDTKFAHLKPEFNDFADISDKADTIDYLKRTYDDKIAYLNDIISTNPDLQRFDASKVYAKINDTADTLYMQGAENDKKTAAVISYAMASDKLKPAALKNIASSFNDFQTVQDKIALYELLHECSITSDDFNAIASKTIISDDDILSRIINKQELSQYIADCKKTNLHEGEIFYKNNAALINAVYDKKTGRVDGINDLMDFTERMNINRADAFLSFYNRASGSKNKSITSDELKAFIELFKYSDADNLFTLAKERKTSVVDILTEEKEKFEQVKDDIEQFILTDETAYFAGKTPLEIYKSYKDLFAENEGNIAEILGNISAFSINTSEEYAQKTAEIDKFSKFFPEREMLLEFISGSGIKFDETDEDNCYIQNCLDIFEALYDESDIEKSQQRINYMAFSGFLNASKAKLPDFLDKMPDEKTKIGVLFAIADKKVPSINSFERFFKTYMHNHDGHPLLEFLQNLPDNIDFDTMSEILCELQYRINSLNIPVDINGGNINSINMERLGNSAYISNEDVLLSVNDMLDLPEDSNFISALPNALDNNTQRFNAYRIAQDIAFKRDKTDESYQNIVRLLSLDKETLGLDSDCSIYTYIRAIEKVLPREFIEFVNSNDWLDYKEDGKTIPNLVLHARLRAVDRFALNNTDSIDSLYTQETKETLKSLFESIYESTPLNVKGTDTSKRIIVDSNYKSDIIEAVFSNKGEMITIVPSKRQTA